MAEAGVPGFEAYAWQGLIGPARLPESVVNTLNKNLVAALEHPEMRAKLEELGIQPDPWRLQPSPTSCARNRSSGVE